MSAPRTTHAPKLETTIRCGRRGQVADTPRRRSLKPMIGRNAPLPSLNTGNVVSRFGSLVVGERRALIPVEIGGATTTSLVKNRSWARRSAISRYYEDIADRWRRDVIHHLVRPRATARPAGSGGSPAWGEAALPPRERNQRRLCLRGRTRSGQPLVQVGDPTSGPADGRPPAQAAPEDPAARPARWAAVLPEAAESAKTMPSLLRSPAAALRCPVGGTFACSRWPTASCSGPVGELGTSHRSCRRRSGRPRPSTGRPRWARRLRPPPLPQ